MRVENGFVVLYYALRFSRSPFQLVTSFLTKAKAMLITQNLQFTKYQTTMKQKVTDSFATNNIEKTKSVRDSDTKKLFSISND